VEYPRSDPSLAKQNGAVVIEVNPEKTFATADYYIAEKAAKALPRIVEEVKNRT
jgi:NAD-dependent SIR2 family protein deacetylase